MLAQRRRPASPTEYLAFERGVETRHELVDGEIVAMTGASWNHVVIADNILMALGQQLKGKSCRPLSHDLRVKVEALDLYTYPDIVVVCGEPRFEDGERDTLLNPALLVEVLSPSTEAYDRGYKARAYRSVPSLATHLLVAQDRVAIEVFDRQPGLPSGWVLRDYTDLDAVIELPAVGGQLALRDVYDQVFA